MVDNDGVQHEVKTAIDAADYLADAWATTVETVELAELVPYSPEVVIRSEEPRALVITDDLRDENGVVEELLAGGDPPQTKPSEVSGDLYLYAVVSDTAAGRIAMIKKKNPTKRANAGKALFGAGDELARLESDPWELHPLFDLFVSENGGYVLNTHFFEQLFSDSDRLRAKIGPWVSEIAARVPMSAESSSLLASARRDSPRHRRRLRAIAHRGHMSRVTLADVRRHIRRMGLRPNDFLQDGQPAVHEDNPGEVLRILNEDLTRGGLTNDRFRIESKEPM